MDSKIYGYARISRKTQNIERQIRNISAAYPTAIIFKEAFTGTKIEGRKELNKLIKRVNEGDTIVFDSVSRMSRNADEGIALYMDLFDRGINLKFLKEPYIDSDTYRKALNNHIALTGNQIADMYIETTNEVLKLLAKEQIRICFEQAEKEVSDLHQRTSEGMKTAKLNGKQIGLPKGTKIETVKSIAAKIQILKLNKSFGGSLANEQTWKALDISRGSFYKYKKELLQDCQKTGDYYKVLEHYEQELSKKHRKNSR